MLRSLRKFSNKICACSSKFINLNVPALPSSFCACTDIRSSTFANVTNQFVIMRPSNRLFHQGIVVPQKIGNSTSAAAAVPSSESSSNTTEERKPKVTVDAEKTLLRLYETYPQLNDYEPTTIIRYLELMIAQTISVDNAVEMLLKYPSLISIYEAKIPSTLSTLRGIGLNEKQRKTLICQHPGLVDLTRSHINKRMAFLKSWFSDAEAIDVVVKSVEALMDHETILKSKLKYLIMSASHETKNIVKSNALSFNLQRMKCRHEFLIRCGLFKPIPYNKMIKVMEKNKAAKDQRDKYFTPQQIVCFRDRDFLRVCTKNAITENELAAFEELYAIEVANEDDDVDDDEEGDVSSDEEYDNDAPPESSSVKTNSGGFASKAESDEFYF